MVKMVTRLTFISLLFVFLSPSYALTVGEKQLNSMLNQKLDASVALLNLRRNEAATLTIALASETIYQRMGVERSHILEKLSFQIQKNQSGQHFIHITSDFIVSKPFVTFLVELNWNNGRLLREFTLFMDPPMFLDENLVALDIILPAQNELLAQFGAGGGFDDGMSDLLLEADSFEADLLETGLKAKKLTPVSFASLSRVPVPKKLPRTVAKKSPVTVAAVNKSVISPVLPVAKKVFAPISLVYAKVERGETLLRIADKIRPADVTIEQMMLGLQKENPKAFLANNLSSLKVGYTLRINDVSTLVNISPVDAEKEVLRQRRVWLAKKEAEARATEARIAAARKIAEVRASEARIAKAKAKARIAEAQIAAEARIADEIRAAEIREAKAKEAETPVVVAVKPRVEIAEPIILEEIALVAEKREVAPKNVVADIVKIELLSQSDVVTLVTLDPVLDQSKNNIQSPIASITLDDLFADKKLLGMGLFSLLLLVVLAGWLINRIFYRKYIIQQPLQDPLSQQVPELTDIADVKTTVIQFDERARKNAEYDADTHESKQPVTVNS